MNQREFQVQHIQLCTKINQLCQQYGAGAYADLAQHQSARLKMNQTDAQIFDNLQIEKEALTKQYYSQFEVKATRSETVTDWYNSGRNLGD